MKLILPEITYPIIDEEKAKKDFHRYFAETPSYKFIPTFEFDNDHFHVKADIDYSQLKGRYFIYAFITNTKYLDNAIIQTDDHYFNSYKSYKSAVKKMSLQIIERYKSWVKNLYKCKETKRCL